ncbi:hypothetical protein BN1708_001075, partial [Verticillium longisporum]
MYAESLGRHVRLAPFVIIAVDLDSQLFAVGSGLGTSDLGLVLLADLFCLLPVTNAVLDNTTARPSLGAGVSRGGPEAGLDLSDPKLALPAKDAIGLLDEVEP